MTDAMKSTDAAASYEPPKPVTRGSQYWMRVAVNHAPEVLNKELRSALNAEAATPVEWLSPLATDKLPYCEYRDSLALDKLGLTLTKPLEDFWPTGGPVWDGLARVGDQRVLVEAKGHISELMSTASRGKESSVEKIETALAQARAALAPRNTLDWSIWNGPFFQYANRLAHLYYFRQVNALPVHMVWVCFLNTAWIDGPKSSAEWLAALQIVEGYLGLGNHGLQKYVHKVFIDVRDLPQDVDLPRY